MSTSPDDRRDPQDPRDTDAEFARMLEQEGLELGPGQAPREPAATEHPPLPGPADRHDWTADGSDDLWSFSADSPPEPPSPESRARSRAAHPAAGGGRAQRNGSEPSDRSGAHDDLDDSDYMTDDEVIYGDFEPPDPDLPEPSSGALWSWTALIVGFLVMLAVTATPSLPGLLGWLGGAAAVGGVVALLLRVPRTREDDNGAEV